MLSDVQISPRPLPPARARRSVSHSRLRSSTDQRPPPPYAPLPDKPTLLGSPIGVTKKLMRLAELTEEEGPETTQTWMQERSKEELEELLQKAGNLIRDREQEFDRTAAACKRLSTSNAILKTENDILLSRIPEYERDSLPFSPSPSAHTLVDAFSPAHSPSHSSVGPPVWSPAIPTTKKHRRAFSHARRPSATPAELAALADQNAELLTKLQDLETDAARAEQAGKRRLKVLEKEIQGLKDELDHTRATSARLEESLQERGGKPIFEGMPEGLEEDLVKLWKRLRRDERVRELRARTRPWEAQAEDSLEDPKDFAPPAPWLSPRRRSSIRKQTSCSTMRSHFQSLSDEGFDTVDQSTSPIIPSSPSSVRGPKSFSTIGHSEREQALVSQLLAKVQELEQTNAQLVSEHQQASRRLMDAQTESDSVKRLCEFIKDEISNTGDGVGSLQLEIAPADAELDSDDSGDQEDVFGVVAQTVGKDVSSASKKRTVTLRSIRSKASLNLDFVRQAGLEDNFSVLSNATRELPHQVKIRQVSPVSEPGAQGANLSRRYRKTVRGLFDDDLITSTPTISPQSALAQDNLIPPVIKASNSFDSTYALEYPQSASEARLPSLSAELGDALNNDRSMLRSHRSFAHLRSTSLADLLSSVDSERAGLSPSPSSSAFLSSSIRGKTETGRRRMLLDYTDAKGSMRLRTLSRSKSSINLRLPSSTVWPDVDSSDRCVVSESTSQDPVGKSRYRLVSLMFELWLWLQFAVLLLVVIYSMARRGPKTFLKVNGKQASKSS